MRNTGSPYRRRSAPDNPVRLLLASSAQAARAAVETLFPPACRSCGCPIPGHRFFCTTCMRTIALETRRPACSRCGADLPQPKPAADHCRSCRRSRPPDHAFVRVAGDGGCIGRMLRHYKFRRRTELEPLLAGLLARRVISACRHEPPDLVTWVPAHWTRRWRQPCYPAARLARRLAVAMDLPIECLLARRAPGRRQRGAGIVRRMHNVRKLYEPAPNADVRGLRILLVDDVATTGATLRACANLLRREGAASVRVAVIVKVDRANLPSGRDAL